MQRRDTTAICASVDLLGLCSPHTHLRRVTAAGEYAGPCPLCGGTDRFHLHAAEHWWFCRNCQPRRGDAIDLVMQLERLSFTAACDYLSGPSPTLTPRKDRPVTPQPTRVAPAPPPAAWQDAALTITRDAFDCLWSERGASARAYLAGRGLSDATIHTAALGYVPRDTRVAGLTVPAGITIPWYWEGDFWQIKVRRRPGQTPKYLSVAGGHPYLYAPAQALDQPGGPLVLCEGEFDALLLHQELQRYTPGLAAVASLGSASLSAATLPETLLSLLRRFDPVLIATDADTAGQAALSVLQRVLPDAVALPVPDGKDITEFYLAGGKLREWVEAYLAAVAYWRDADDEPGSAKPPSLADANHEAVPA